nr:MAG TPA: hypothetical protein [Caudoviricetes sp.]
MSTCIPRLRRNRRRRFFAQKGCLSPVGSERASARQRLPARPERTTL